MPRSSGYLRRLLYSGLFAALTAVLSFVRIPLPFSAVPVTGQSLGTMMAGLLLGPWPGALSQLIYVLVGAAGMPVFGGMGGPAMLIGPTGGYLLGMIPGAFVTGWLARSSRPVRMTAACLIGGVVVVHLLGVWWLSRVASLDAAAALMTGSIPFWPGDVLKTAAAVGLALRLRRVGLGTD